MTEHYPTGTVRALIAGDHVSEATRRAVRERLDGQPVERPAFLTFHEYDTLRSLCARLLPQPDRMEPIDLAGPIDRRLASGSGDGWCYDALPSDGELYRRFLRGLDELAGPGGFAALTGAEQDAVIARIERGDVDGGTWDEIPAERAFEEILAEATEAYYAHPLALEEIGYAGMADLPGWTRIGLDEREDREPVPLASG